MIYCRLTYLSMKNCTKSNKTINELAKLSTVFQQECDELGKYYYQLAMFVDETFVTPLFFA